MANDTFTTFDSGTELLRVETNLFELYIAGEPLHETAERLKLHRDIETGERLTAVFDAEVRSLRLTDCEVRLFDPESQQTQLWKPGMPAFPCFYETKSYELTVVKSDPSLNLTFHHENINLRRRIKPRGSRVLSGNLDFGNEIGETELEIRLNDRPLLTITIEIFPAKIDYRRDYIRLMEEVSEESYDLTFDFLRRTYRPAEEQETSRQSLSEFHTILRRVFERLEQAMMRIEAHPHHRLENEHRLVDAAKVRRIDRRTINDLRRHPQRLQPVQPQGRSSEPLRQGSDLSSLSQWMPSQLLEGRRVISNDTEENRFLRWMLERISSRVETLRLVVNDSRPGRDPLVKRELDKISKRLHSMLNQSFLKDVGSMKRVNISLIFQMAPGYREMYKIHLLLLKGLSLREGMMRLSLKDMAQLYEYWCFLKLHRLLARRCRVTRREGAAIDRTGLFPSLIRGQASRVDYEHVESGATLSLLYNPSMQGRNRPTTEQKPDLLLTLYTQGEEDSYVLDAKYRIDPALPGSRYASLYQAPGPLEEDINVMHRYRDAIVTPSEVGYRRRVSSACVLFPYGDETEYTQHHFYRSIQKVGVGGLPFLPGATRLAERWIDQLLENEKAYEE
ncbi:restriction endonuclease-like protein [Saccharibacillus sp. JS10]|uniref:restriction endonuclease-like protein n=1 Tax=Saccharibacillus sp. JS10 TaxID=2950552 RepID=UPI00210F0750|nr:restriction endonuclease-like protein [Saccharibacillus sp. JS10]MCQ4086584.1 restriction endonuclease-like protein [Saccharibacillus sp. JS10]